MSAEGMTEQITHALERGIRESIEARDAGPFRRAAIEAYRLSAGGRPPEDDDDILHHVFPGDVQQIVLLSLRLLDTDREKASSLFKGALDQVLSRLSFTQALRVKGPWWRFWDK